MPMSYLQTVFHPEQYHGHHKTPPFFEGWYYKLVDSEGKAKFAIIPGIFLSADPEKQHAFIQVLNGSTGQATYHRYPAELFWAAEDSFEVRIGNSYFSDEQIFLDIADQGQCVQGEIQFGRLQPWPITWTSPGIMGLFGYLPNMECNHGVVSLDHELQGCLSINGREQNFSGGRGYIEKDWGASFPAGYVWMQTNHFHTVGTSFMGSIAIIPYMGVTFPGIICGLWHKGQLHRFATYTGAQTEKLVITDTHVHWVIRGRNKRLKIEAQRAQGGLLYGPTRENMSDRVGETMQAEITVQLTAVKGQQERLLFTGSGHSAGLEIHGDIKQLLAMQK